VQLFGVTSLALEVSWAVFCCLGTSSEQQSTISFQRE
jgi:hypothetical protein